MKRDGAHSGALLPGKAVLIVITATAVTGGFALGYFAGKSASSSSDPSILKHPASGDLLSAPNSPSGLKDEVPSPLPPQTQPSPPEHTQASATPSPYGAAPFAADVKSEEKSGAKGQQAAMTEKKVLPGSGERSIPPAGFANQDKGARSISDPEETAQNTPLQSADSLSKKAVYTVQAAAFRRQKDADALRQTLEDRGYQVTVRKEPDQRGVVFFKVRVGEFVQKKEASVFAQKLRKTDGLNAFAVLKNQ